MVLWKTPDMDHEASLYNSSNSIGKSKSIQRTKSTSIVAFRIFNSPRVYVLIDLRWMDKVYYKLKLDRRLLKVV